MMKNLSSKMLLLLVWALPQLVLAGELPFKKARIAVAPEVQKSFVAGGRIILRLTRQNLKEPRQQAELTVGITPANWNGNTIYTLNAGDKSLLSNGSEKWNPATPGKVYCQVLYKQNIDDGQENVPGNLISNIDSLSLTPASELKFTLNRMIPKNLLAENKYVKYIEIKSKSLSDFSGHPRYLKASVLLPAGYFDHPAQSYPICYRAPGLNGRFTGIEGKLKEKGFADWWFSDNAPRIIYVFLDSQGPYGDTYQVDSENNGPCGKALTEELIPEIEKMVNYNPASHKRYLTGMSTGGWVAFGLQVLYPDFFDGTWSYSPDPVDFEHYGLINIYKDETIFYNHWGFLQPGKRTIYGEPTFSMKEWIAGENVMSKTGDYRISGGQFGAYNAVFGPKEKDGLPSLMFDPFTGKIDHEIARQWEKYDLKKILEKNWATLGPKLQGKIWIWTGDMDGLYSNVATRFLKIFLDKTENPKSDAKISFTPMAGHCQEWSDENVIRMVAEKAAKK